jgi:hypothetical protein
MLTVAPDTKLRLAAAFRYGWLDRALGAVTSRDFSEQFVVPRYQDFQAKAQLSLRRRESLDVVALGSNDDRTLSSADPDPASVRREDTNVRFERVYLRYRRELDDGALVEVVPWVGIDESHTTQRFGDDPARLDERALRWGLLAAHRSRLGSSVALTMGIDVASASSDLFREGSLASPPREGDIAVFGQPPSDGINADSWNTTMIDVGPYASFDLRFGPVSLTPGLRVDGYLLEASRQTPRVGETPSIGISQLEARVEPRVAGRVRITPSFAVLAAAGVYSQPPAATDLSAVFGTPSLGPEEAYHAVLGESLSVTKTLSLEAVGFYKWMDDLAVPDRSPTPKLAHVLLPDGVGRSFGVQWLLRQELWHGISGWIAYTISRSERRDEPDSGWRLFDDDEPHVLTVVASDEQGPWTLGARFRYARGLPRTPVIGAFYDARDDVFRPLLGPQNSIRLPDFWQLDLRVSRRFGLGDRLSLDLYAEALNVTNHPNAEEFAYGFDYRQRGVVTGLPITPIAGARLEL